MGFRITRSRYGMVADCTWLWISGWKLNPVIFERHFNTTLKIFKVLCNNIEVFKSGHEDVVLLPTAFSWSEYFFLLLQCVTFYSLVHFLRAPGRSLISGLHPGEAAKVTLCQTTATVLLISSILLQSQITVFSKQPFPDICSNGWVSQCLIIK